MSELVPWGFRCVAVLVALGYIAVGASVVRAANPVSGYLLIAVGVFSLLARCCSTAIFYGVVQGGADPELFMLSGLVSMGETVINGVMIAVAAVMLANAASTPAAAPPPGGPPPRQF